MNSLSGPARLRSLLLAGVVGAATLLVPPAMAADPSGGDLAAACRENQAQIPEIPDVFTPGPITCRLLQGVLWGVAAGCRPEMDVLAVGVTGTDLASPKTCALIDGRPVSDERIAAYQSSWVHRALTLQRGLDDSAPFVDGLLLHTHNSFNAPAYDTRTSINPSRPGYYPTVTNQDANQVYSLTGQLEMDVRVIELDLHWMPSPFGTIETNGQWVTLCHGNSGNDLGLHVGCSIDRPFEDGLHEIRTWLDTHPSEVIVLYLENQLSGDPTAHDVAGQLLNASMGKLVDRPATPCADMDWRRTRSSIRAAGKRLVVVGDCDAGKATAWGGLVHQRGSMWKESGNPSPYTPDRCAADQAASRGGRTLRRLYEDSTNVAAVAGSSPFTSGEGNTTVVSVDDTKAMVRCGVNFVGFDQLVPEDPRLAAAVWSWAVDEPRANGGDCGFQGGDTRFRAGDCGQARPAACLDGSNVWRVTKKPVRWDDAASQCGKEFGGFRFAVPVNGMRNNQLAAAKPGGKGEVWVNQHRRGATWSS